MSSPIYLDNQSTTPLDPQVAEVMQEALQRHFGNASSSTHAQGWAAEELVEIAREQVAELINAEANQIIFTSGATESNNIALLGFARANSNVHILSANTEHRAVLDPLDHLSKNSAEVTLVQANSKGLIEVEAIEEACRENTQLASFMHGNNEIGVLNDIQSIADSLKEKGIYLHCDATQALGKVDFDVKKIKVDYASFSSHKLYGPKGIGALYIANSQAASKLEALQFGGEQENGLRPGTLNVPAIVGFGEACRVSRETEDKEKTKLLRDKLLLLLEEKISGLKVNGCMENRLAGNLNFSISDIQSAALIGEVSKDISISSSSACSSNSDKPSHVLSALNLSEEELQSSIRIGIGRFNTEEEIEQAAEVIARAAEKLRS